MFQVNGANGIYDNKINDESIKYGRNEVDNKIQNMEKPFMEGLTNMNPAPILDFGIDTDATDKNIEALEKFVNENDRYLAALPPLEYEYRYMPNFENGNFNKKALLAAAYEEMNGVKELAVKDFEARYLINDEMTAEPLDINKDGKIDIAEYSANMLATDLLSKGTTDLSKINGSMNSMGMNAILEYTKKANAQAATNLYSSIYNTYNLGSALNELNLD